MIWPIMRKHPMAEGQASQCKGWAGETESCSLAETSRGVNVPPADLEEGRATKIDAPVLTISRP